MDSISNIIHSLGGEIRITHINGEGGIYCSFSAHEMQIDDILLFDFAKSISNFCKNRSICHEHGWLEDTNLFLNLISNSEDLMRIEFVYNELIVLSVAISKSIAEKQADELLALESKIRSSM